MCFMNLHNIINNKPDVDVHCVIIMSDVFNLHSIINDKPDVTYLVSLILVRLTAECCP